MPHSFALPARFLPALLTILALDASAAAAATTGPAVPAASEGAVKALEAWLAAPPAERPDLAAQSFATTPVTKADAARAKSLLWEDRLALLRATRAAEMAAKRIELNGRTMRFEWRTYGKKPEGGHSLFLSMHGGGGTEPPVNDSQWKNQLRLGDAYRPTEGLYLAPRAPTDTWNLWHEAHIDAFFDRLIANLIALEGINPNRVYLLGYSAGGDGVYQLAPRMADRFAAVAMMAGHPNETSPLGLRNLGFALHMGALDAAYNRNEVARKWGQELASLRAQDPDGYPHQVVLHEGKGHWMELQDRQAIPWMETFTRQPWPDVVVWKQDDVIHPRLYWLSVDPSQAKAGDEITARRDGTRITLKTSRPLDVTLVLDDALLDLDQSVTVTTAEGTTLFSGTPTRTIGAIHRSLTARDQLPLAATAEVPLLIPAPPTQESRDSQK